MVCRVCALDKPADQMKLRLGQRVNICKACDSARARAYHAAHKPERQSYSRSYRLRDHARANERERGERRQADAAYRAKRRDAHRLMRQRPDVKDSRREYQRQWAKNHPQKAYAHTAVKYALKAGRLTKPEACEDCGSGQFKLHGHHDDYDRPLDVRWLCPLCHKAAHKEINVSTYKRDESEIGALWLRQGPKGEYLTGEVNGVQVICFPNRSDNVKAPAWRVMKSKPREESASRPTYNANQPPPFTDDDLKF